jgi:periplasmic protein TonB
MSYQALLFCPDEKTARIVGQVLADLDFIVEPCNEPFAAVKKLMAQHFDAIVVDCDNEQNAALLFKSARNSGSNEASLAVAVVEGQAGVAKAFRLGANLVLTKPIHIEQSKGTLRVARGLLRKGQAARPAGAVPASSEPVVAPPSIAAPSFSAPSVSKPSFSTPSLSAPSFSAPSASVGLPSAPSTAASFPAHSITPPPAANASAFELDAEPTPQPDTVDAALLEYMPDSVPAGTQNSQPSTADSTSSRQYAWQPRSKPMAEPMASALRRAAEVAGKSEFEAPAANSSSAARGNNGAAAAPARARELAEPSQAAIELKPAVAVTPARSKPASDKNQESVVAEAWGSNRAMLASEAPTLAAVSEPADAHTSDSGGSKKVPIAVILLLGIAAAGYFGWTKMQSGHSQPAPQAIAPTNSGAVSLPANPAPSGSDSQPVADEVVPQPAAVPTQPGSAVPLSKPSAAIVAEAPGAKTSPATSPATKAVATSGDETSAVKAPVAAKAEPAQALVVKNGSSTQPKTATEAQEAEQAPDATSIATNTNNSALTGLVDTTAVNATKAAQQTLRISQGVSQGLIVKRVQPVYPPQALQMRLDGKVELQANITKTGNTSGIKQLSGEKILGRAAMDAVRQWKYKPYYLNGEPVEVETQITVNFKLP